MWKPWFSLNWNLYVCLSCLVAVYEETAGLTVRDPVLRTHKVNNAKLYCFLLGLQYTVFFSFWRNFLLWRRSHFLSSYHGDRYTDLELLLVFLGKGLNLNWSRSVRFVNGRNSLDRLGDFDLCVTQVFAMCAATFCGAWAWDPWEYLWWNSGLLWEVVLLNVIGDALEFLFLQFEMFEHEF